MTLRIERAHAMIKKYLGVSTGDLQAVYQKIDLALEDQKQEIQVRKSLEQIKLLYIYNIFFFAPVHYKVLIFILRKVYKQYQKVIETTAVNLLELYLKIFK